MPNESQGILGEFGIRQFQQLKGVSIQCQTDRGGEKIQETYRIVYLLYTEEQLKVRNITMIGEKIS